VHRTIFLKRNFQKHFSKEPFQSRKLSIIKCTEQFC